MKIENQVCTLEQAKKLNGAAIVQDSLNWWKCNDEQNVVICGCNKKMNEKYFGFNEWYSAFTVAELGVMLPDHFVSGKVRRTGDFGCTKFRGGATEYDKIYTTESEARAAMLIYLLENNIITAEEINNRLNH